MPAVSCVPADDLTRGEGCGETQLTDTEFLRRKVLRNVALHLESTLGNADKFQPGLTHVLLMAILLAVVLSMKSLSRAVANASAKRD